MKPLLIMTLSVSAWAQQTPGLHARELFYTPPAQTQTQPPAQPEPAKPPTPKAPTPKASSKTSSKTPVTGTSGGEGHTIQASLPLGLRYSILRRGDNNQFAEVDPDSTFKSGDRVRFEVKTNTSGYLYIVMQGSSGSWRLLFPSSEVAGGSNFVKPGELRTVPPGDRGQFVFDEQAGTEKLFVVLTRQPEPDLDKLIYAMGGPQKNAADHAVLAGNSVSDDVVNRLRKEMASRDLVFEKSDEDQNGQPEKAAYVANPSTASDARLVVDIPLHHK